MAENNNIIIRELNPTKKEEGDIFFHNEYNDIVDVAKNHADVLRKLYGNQFKFDVNIKCNREICETGENVNLKFDWEYDRDLTDQYISEQNNPETSIPVTLRTKTFNNITRNFQISITGISNEDRVKKYKRIEFVDAFRIGSNSLTTLQNSHYLTLQNKELLKYYELEEYYGGFGDNGNEIQPESSHTANYNLSYDIDCTDGKYIYIVIPELWKDNYEVFTNELKNSAWEESEVTITNEFRSAKKFTVLRSTYKFYSDKISIRVKLSK